MKKKVILAPAVSFILLLLVILAGLNAVYTVTSVRANFCTFSEEGESEARELQEKLDSFVNKSEVFLDLDDVRETVEQYPYFRVEEVRKNYPDKLELKITERKEAFAYLNKNGKYVILDEQGQLLREEASNVNRAGGKNILLKSFDFEGGGEVRYFEELIKIFTSFQEVLTEARANITSIELFVRGAADYTEIDYIRVQMREGVFFDILNPNVQPYEKAHLAVERYAGTGRFIGNGLTDVQRVKEEITVYELDGELKLSYKL